MTPTKKSVHISDGWEKLHVWAFRSSTVNLKQEIVQSEENIGVKLLVISAL
jgi:hypothetical protein